MSIIIPTIITRLYILIFIISRVHEANGSTENEKMLSDVKHKYHKTNSWLLDITLFLPMPLAFGRRSIEWESIFLQTFLFFWPIQYI